jgi:hypothetical protein
MCRFEGCLPLFCCGLNTSMGPITDILIIMQDLSNASVRTDLQSGNKSPSDYIKCGKISSLAEELLTSQEGLHLPTQ